MAPSPKAAESGCLWIIDPSLTVAETQGVATVVAGWKGHHRLFQPALEPGDEPRGYDCDGIVLLGSAASVFDPLPWLAGLSTWLRPIVTGEVPRPLLGICFGHQLIGHLAGATVGFLQDDRAKRVGIEETEICGGRLLGDRQSFPVVVSHREHVERCPDGFEVTATRPGVPVDGLEHRTLPIFSYQFHPEAREEFATRSGIPVEKIDRTLQSANQRLMTAFFSALR